MESEERRDSDSSEESEYVIRRVVYKPPSEYVRPPDAIPFHIPHKIFLEKAEVKEETLMPLAGFIENQNRRRHKMAGEAAVDQAAEVKPIKRRKFSLSRRISPAIKESATVAAKVQAAKERAAKEVNLADQKELISRLQKDASIGFLYMIYAATRDSEIYTPYCLKVVPFEKIDRHNFFTISANGVTHYSAEDMIFTPLDIWEREYDYYCRIVEIKTFKQFRMWKAYYVWRKSLVWKKYTSARNNIEKKLLILNTDFQTALLTIQKKYFELEDKGFADMRKREKNLLFYFWETQMAKLEILQQHLKELHIEVKQLMYSCCIGALWNQGFLIDDSNFTIGEAAKARRIRSDKPKMTYVDQANKRRFCERISCFICLVDYMMTNMLHRLLMNTLEDLCFELKTHYSFLPSEEVLNTTETDAQLEEPRPAGAPQFPMFLVDVLINTEGMYFEPSEQIFMEVFSQLTEFWHETVLSVLNYLPDTHFNVFTEPVINAKLEERLIGYGPKLLDILEENPQRKRVRKEISFYLKDSFEAAMKYLQRFNFILEFYQENNKKEISSIKRERDIEKFRGLLKSYHQQLDDVNKMAEQQTLGLLHLWLKRFKEIVIPSSQSLLLVVEKVIPWIGKHKIDSLIQTAQHATKNLSLDPKTTLEYVHYLEFLESVQPLLEKMEVQMDYTKELYDLIEEFKVPCPPEDVANYLGFSVTSTSLRNTVEKKVAATDKMIGKFTEQINKDFSELISEVGDIKDEATQPWLIDIKSNPEEAKVTLDALYDQLMETQKTANLYKSYQKKFRLEVTRFELLDDVINHVRLRTLLWESLEEWDRVVEEYTKQDFNTLDPEEINLFVAKNLKNINTFEKNIPPNDIVPKLKIRVQILKDKLPVITNLRNPTLKNRHWMRIENLLNFHFKKDTVVTLELLEKLKVFNFEEELQEISKQASSEASLEALLKEVEENWKELEFTVLPYHDTKDVFILGGTDDIQQVLDDSFIKINTISSSKNVGPIKQRVDEWARLLDIFSSTLDEITTCQLSWLYLEPIFSAPDIQRQLPNEAKMFTVVDKSFKDTMRKIAKMPLALRACTQPGLLEEFQNNNYLLEQIMKCLEAYLESKRVVFPRFYFLSNDELLEILAQTRNPFAVQPYLRKCFDAIAKLEFGSWAMEEVTEEAEEEDEEEGEGAQAAMKTSTDILAMISPEGETIGLTRGLKVRGNIEDWLGKVEESMFSSVRRRMIGSLKDYFQRPLQKWILLHPSQIVLTVSQIMWAQNVHKVFSASKNVEQGMKDFEQECNEELNKLAAMVRGKLEPLQRSIVCSLITVEVHARDNITLLVRARVTLSTSFEWLKQLRYYWDTSVENCIARMSNSTYAYGYEYLGASPRLVITPLTDKCYLCLLGALQLDLGGAPAGPAGTGKTETTKDLAKSMAIMCVVFNCSDGLDYKIMGRFFAGLAESGGWCCFDEFNRIDIEVLSVIAQQLITIRNAKLARQTRFMFEGREIKLNRTCAAFITMNPGYAGRTELPDNLKALFRPVSMMVPDYGLIAEVILYSEGFESSHVLANKMVQMYKLCSEQLSQQDHYDFGMRAVKSVLVMAGSLKRANPDQTEDIVLINALCDSNLPKFLVSDAELFQNIINDLFPGVTIPEKEHGNLLKAIMAVMEEHDWQTEETLIRKVIQFNETMIVRHGVMLCGPTGGGKTTIINVLKYTLTKLFEDKIPGAYFRPVTTYTLNPKSVSLGELYGEVNQQTLEWKDGLLGITVRTAVKIEDEIHQWIVCDGPVDAVWIENLNTALDDNKMVCLANSERIKFTPWVHMVFETDDLSHASPATVSRVGMVYVDPEELKWLPFVRTWINTLTIPDNLKEYIDGLFTTYVEDGLSFIKKNCDYAIHQVDISKATMMCNLMESLMQTPDAVDPKADELRNKNFLCQSFVFSFLWSIGGNIVDHSREIFEVYVRSQFDEHPDARIPSSGDLWSLYLNVKQKKMDVWEKIKPDFQYTKIPFFDIVVPTNETTKFGYIMELLLAVDSPVLFTGLTGVGKTIVAKTVLSNLAKRGDTIQIPLNFSAQTSSPSVQEAMEERLKKQKKGVLGPPSGKKIVIFADDVNMPKLEVYGAQPPIELMRQYLDFHGLYDREKLFWKYIEGVIITAACAPPGGGRNPLTARFVRHFAMLLIPTPDESALKTIFKPIVAGFLQEFPKPVAEIGGSIVNASIDIYDRIATDLLPTPEKAHYVFNLRDLSKCVQGLLQADAGVFTDVTSILRLFYHESLRVFHDRLINKEDKSYFYRLMNELCVRHFNNCVLTLPEGDDVIEKPPALIFGDFMNIGASKENKIYEEIQDFEKLKNVLQEYLDDYNLTYQKDVKMVFFMDAMEHITRTARILRVQRGNALLVGTAGMGKKSVTRLASHCCDYKCFQIELACNYTTSSFHDDLRKLYYIAGVDNLSTSFLMTDTEIVEEEFLEDINNILNSGEVPNLFDAAENKEAVMSGMRPQAKSVGLTESNQEGLFACFIGRVKSNLHLVLCMSPVGDAFRRRCRMFPSLINCCTIDWYVNWPQDALLSVAQITLKDIRDEDTVANLGQICVIMHESVTEAAAKFYDEMRRRYYITPSNYLALIKVYLIILEVKEGEIKARRERIGNGLKKLLETNALVDTMKQQLVAFEPELKKKSADTELLMKNVAKEQAQADKVRQVVMADESIAKAKAEETQLLADDAQKDLAEALPAMEEAMKALNALNKNDINELRVFNKPPTLVKFVMEAVNLLLGQKLDWKSAKSVLGDMNFLRNLQEYDKDKISDVLLKKLKHYVDNPDFVPAKVAAQSKACKSLCMWVIAMNKYAVVYRIVEPKKKKVMEAEAELNQIMSVLREKQQRLADVEAQIAALEASYDASLAEKKNLEDTIEITANRLIRAGRLTSALGDEQVRWEESIKDLNASLHTVIGDVLIAAGCVAYLGAFTNEYRLDLVSLWTTYCKRVNLPASEGFSLIAVLTDQFEIRKWNMFGLPRDTISTENAIIVTKAQRWPLMIDPQEQANQWIRHMENENGLKIIKLTDSSFMRVVENSIRLGMPVLLEEVGETLDPALNPVLLKATFIQAARVLIRLGDSEIEYDENFRLYITTKLSNPHYLPELCIIVTLINFTVTPSGLEDQLLSDVVRLVLPELEILRNDLISRISSDKNQLFMIEDKILQNLFASKGNILDDEVLIDSLNESKETAGIIAVRLVEAEDTEKTITGEREKYRSVANRGSVLYFVVMLLGEIDPMYQFSLKYFNQIFSTVVETTEKLEELEQYLQSLLKNMTLAVYMNVSRGLFERHKLVFSFMLCANILRQMGTIKDEHWNFLLRGPLGMKRGADSKPDVTTLSPQMWMCAKYLVENFKNFKTLTEEVLTKMYLKIGSYEQTINVSRAEDNEGITNWNEKLDDFEKLMLIKALQEEKLVFAITAYVREKLGKPFVESPQISLPSLYRDMSCFIPLIFVLSTGSDPFGALHRFAGEIGCQEKLKSISLGQGQGPIAEKMITAGLAKGEWVYLQNCHLATSWMLSMEKIVHRISEVPEKTHQDFRLFLSSMPSLSFPVSVLQNSVKVTTEPPKGLRANIKRAFADMTEDFFEAHGLGPSWRKMIFGICFFHAIIQERKKFGPLGWNITYEFTESDRECAILNLQKFCEDNTIPWDALDYITGEIVYGGRVTDHWDLRCLKTILVRFFAPHTLDPGYLYSASGIYFAPETLAQGKLAAYKQYIDELPLMENTEIFGMHENANVVFQKRESKNIIDIILEVNPKTSSSAGAKSPDAIVYELADIIMEQIDQHIDAQEPLPALLKRDEKGRLPSLSTVIFQEVDRFNKLLTKLHSSLFNLQRAIKGFVVMSEDLEALYNACMNNQIPAMWSALAYPSIKNLGSWIHDLEMRLDLIKIWVKHGPPTSFWISGIFFPQGFLTGVLQTHARKYSLPIDELDFVFEVEKIILDQENILKAHIEANHEVPEAYQALSAPVDGVLIHGLFLDAASWNMKENILAESNPGEMNPPMPVLRLTPTTKVIYKDIRYSCPLYKTGVRAGVLSTTGHSTNFVMTVQLPSHQEQNFWILMGTALLMQVMD